MVQNAKLLVVGAGGIGCELLKNLAPWRNCGRAETLRINNSNDFFREDGGIGNDLLWFRIVDGQILTS